MRLTTVDKIQSGEELLFTEVFNAYHNKLYGYFYNKSKSVDTARELTQLAFIKLWRFRDTLTNEIPFDKQLFTLAVSVFIDHLRAQASRAKCVALSDATDAIPRTHHVQFASDLEHRDDLHQRVSTLPPTRQKVFILSRLHGYSNKAISEHLSITVKTVEDHMTKALRHLRSIANILY